MAGIAGTVTTVMSGGTYNVNGTDVVCGNVRTAKVTVYIIGSVLMPKSPEPRCRAAKPVRAPPGSGPGNIAGAWPGHGGSLGAPPCS